MARIISTRNLAKALEAEGYPVPLDCREVRLVIEPNGPFVVQFDCYVSDENLVKLGRALLAIGLKEVELNESDA